MAAVIGGLGSAYVAFYGLPPLQEAGWSASTLLNLALAAIFFSLGYGIYRASRICAVMALLLFVFERIRMYDAVAAVESARGPGILLGFWISVVFLAALYALGVGGTFALERAQIAASDFKVTWRQRAGLFALAFFGFTLVQSISARIEHLIPTIRDSWLVLPEFAVSFVATVAIVEAFVASWQWLRRGRDRATAGERWPTWRHRAALLALAYLGYTLMVLASVAQRGVIGPLPDRSLTVEAVIASLAVTVLIVEGFIAICRRVQRGSLAARVRPAH